MNHFTYGALNPALAYALSCTGACLGLLCAGRAKACAGPARFGWLSMSAVALGGTGIWVMHFVAMLGFSVDGADIRYDVPMTLTSLALAVVVVAIGLALTIQGDGSLRSVAGGGLVTGLGVAVMHYLGMAAMHTGVTIHYNKVLVALSVVIAVAAATAALWAALNVRGRWAVAGAVPVMGIAVSGMHYTGMAAMSRDPRPGTGTLTAHGAEATSLLAPLITGISLMTMILLFVVAVWPSIGDMRDEADFDARVARLRSRQVVS